MKKVRKVQFFVHFVQVKCVRFWESGLYLNWLLPVQVLWFTFGSRDSPKPFYTWVTFFKVSQISPGDPISTELCLQLHFRRLYLCILFALKYASYLEFQLQLSYNQIKFVWFTFRWKDFPKFLLHLGCVLQNIKLEYKTP